MNYLILKTLTFPLQCSPSASPVSFYHGGYCENPTNCDVAPHPSHDYHAGVITEIANAYNFAQADYEAAWPQEGVPHHPINILSSGTK